MAFYCSNIPSKMFYGSTGAEFLRIFIAASKIEDLSCSCKQLLSWTLKQIELVLMMEIARLLVLCNKFEKREAFKKYLSEELMHASWYQKRWCDWCLPEDGKKGIEPIFTEKSGKC